MLVTRIALTVCLALPCAGQSQVASPPSGPLFTRLFVRPTATNGMEQIIGAADLVSDLPSIDDASAPDATLTHKRAVLREPSARQALRLLREGLAKPTLVLDASPELHMQAMAAFRRLGRLLAVEQYVLWADGQTSAALTCLADGLKLGYLAQRQAAIGGLVGIAIDAMVLAQALSRVAQWSSADCAAARRLAEEWMRAPDPAITALELEHRSAVRQLESLPMAREVGELLASRFRMLSDVLRKPAWTRRVPEPVSGSSPSEEMAKALWTTMRPAFERVLERWTAELAHIQLLGVHGGVRGYLWEHGHVPAALEDLALGGLAVDPFTGQPLAYKATGRNTYELYSVGPFARDAEGRPTSVRQPIGLTSSDAIPPPRL